MPARGIILFPMDWDLGPDCSYIVKWIRELKANMFKVANGLQSLELHMKALLIRPEDGAVKLRGMPFAYLVSDMT